MHIRDLEIAHHMFVGELHASRTCLQQIPMVHGTMSAGFAALVRKVFALETDLFPLPSPIAFVPIPYIVHTLSGQILRDSYVKNCSDVCRVLVHAFVGMVLVGIGSNLVRSRHRGYPGDRGSGSFSNCLFH